MYRSGLKIIQAFTIIYLFFLIEIIFCKNASAQFPVPFEQDTYYITTAYGVLTPISIFNYILLKNDTIIKTKQIGPVYLKYEKSVGNDFGLGINLSYVYNQWEAPGQSYSNTSSFLKRHSYSALVRLNYHLYNKRYYDLFTGFGIGFRRADLIYNIEVPDSIGKPISFPIGFEFGIGGKYFLNPDLALYFELGASKSFLQGGLTYSFRSKKYYDSKLPSD